MLSENGKKVNNNKKIRRRLEFKFNQKMAHLVRCNRFAQEWKDIFGGRDVVESFRFDFTVNFK